MIRRRISYPGLFEHDLPSILRISRQSLTVCRIDLYVFTRIHGCMCYAAAAKMKSSRAMQINLPRPMLFMIHLSPIDVQMPIPLSTMKTSTLFYIPFL